MLKFEHMFQPITMGSMTVKKRVAVPPMGNNDANKDEVGANNPSLTTATVPKGTLV